MVLFLMYIAGFLYNLLGLVIIVRESWSDSFWHALLWPIYYIEVIWSWMQKLWK